MKTPYEILTVREDADDEAVKKAYLAAVKKFPPERFPEEFRKIRDAYEKIGTTKARLEYALFDVTMPDHLEIAEHLIKDSSGRERLSEKKFRKLLAGCLESLSPEVPGGP